MSQYDYILHYYFATKCNKLDKCDEHYSKTGCLCDGDVKYINRTYAKVKLCGFHCEQEYIRLETIYLNNLAKEQS